MLSSMIAQPARLPDGGIAQLPREHRGRLGQ
jgi:hypothetical protein